MLKKLLSAALFAIITSSPAFAADPEHLYVTATNVRIRQTPSTTAPVAATLPIGAWGKILEKSSEKQTLMGKNDYWYKISVDNKQQGWIFGGLVIAVSEEDRFSKALELINSRLEMTDKPLEDHVQVYEFAKAVKELASHSAEKARLELAFLKTIDSVCNKLSEANQGTLKTNKAIKENENIVYQHECAGRHYVEAKAYWDLAEKYADIPAAADEIAWAAANQPLNGETEGDPMAVLSFFDASTAVYISKFPAGKSIDEALEHGVDTFKFVRDNLADDYFNADSAEDKRLFAENISKFAKTAESCPESANRKAYIEVLGEISSKLSK